MIQDMIALIDYGMGNLLSVFNALDLLGADVEICSDPEAIGGAERIVLPGVGAFGDCMDNLAIADLVEVLNKAIVEERKPILGICLGMQAMALRSEEAVEREGFGWFDAEVVRIEPDNPELHIPHIGWNNIEHDADCPLFKGLPLSPDFYFVHSYYMKCNNMRNIVATCDYGGRITAAVQNDNIFATQFHLEKSQDYGLRILENFLDWNP